MSEWGASSPAVLRLRTGAKRAGAVTAFGGLFLLAFFTFHFGLVHLGDAGFLSAFSPPDGVLRVGGALGGVLMVLGW